ncbi:MAG TPA: hypothetical protein PLQ71_02990 [Nitrospira sp.]|nr:hypothetical protein [Nitrospira sp.]
MLTTVILGGPLGKKYGRRFEFMLHRPIDAIKALHCNFPDFVETMQGYADKGMEFRITDLSDGRRDLSLDESTTLNRPKVLRLAPVVAGASEQTAKANTQLAIATVLAVAAIALSGGTTAPWVVQALAAMSVSFAIQGALGHYAAHQSKKNKKEQKEKNPSNLFSNQENVTEAGGPVPVGYGQMMVGSTVIGVAYEVYDMPLN